MTQAKPILEQAQEITSGARRRDYGRPLVNHLRIALMWSIQDEKPVSPIDVAWKMVTLKAAREIHTPKFDNLLDTIGYAACADDMGRQMVELGYVKTVEEGINYLRGMSVGQMFDLMIECKAADELAKLVEQITEENKPDSYAPYSVGVDVGHEGSSFTAFIQTSSPMSVSDILAELARRGINLDGATVSPVAMDSYAVKAAANKDKCFCPDCGETAYLGLLEQHECEACGRKFANDDIPF